MRVRVWEWSSGVGGGGVLEAWHVKLPLLVAELRGTRARGHQVLVERARGRRREVRVEDADVADGLAGLVALEQRLRAMGGRGRSWEVMGGRGRSWEVTGGHLCARRRRRRVAVESAQAPARKAARGDALWHSAAARLHSAALGGSSAAVGGHGRRHSRRRTIRRHSGGAQEALRRHSGGYQEAIRRPSRDHQEAISRSSGGPIRLRTRWRRAAAAARRPCSCRW